MWMDVYLSDVEQNSNYIRLDCLADADDVVANTVVADSSLPCPSFPASSGEAGLCFNQGTCQQQSGGAKVCHCYSGWSGAACQYPNCPPSPPTYLSVSGLLAPSCANHGYCGVGIKQAAHQNVTIKMCSGTGLDVSATKYEIVSFPPFAEGTAEAGDSYSSTHTAPAKGQCSSESISLTDGGAHVLRAFQGGTGWGAGTYLTITAGTIGQVGYAMYSYTPPCTLAIHPLTPPHPPSHSPTLSPHPFTPPFYPTLLPHPFIRPT
jgi:hypothetical protein